jgi:iron(III) transport system permease protein
MTAANTTGRLSLKRGSARWFHHTRSSPATLAAGAIAIGAALLAMAPLASLIVMAFGQTGDLWLHLIRYVVPSALTQTVLLLAGVAAVTIVIGVGAAWAVTTFDFPGRNMLSWMLVLPLALPTYIVAYLLGARPFRVALQISLPLARPAVAVGVSLAMLETLNDIGLSEYLGVHTLTLSIFTTWLNRGSLAGAAQIACVMLLFVAALIALERYGRRGRAFTAMGQQGARFASRIALKGAEGLLATVLCFLPVVLGFLLPAAYLLYEVIARGLLVGFEPELIRPALTTIALAAAATALVLFTGFTAVAATRYLRGAFVAGCVNVAGIGYAIPGTVLALGLLTPLVLADEAINAAARALGGSGVGLILAGSVAALIIAYLIRFLAIALGFAQAGFSRIAPEFEDVARMLGAGPTTLARTIHLPLIRPAIFGAALLVFVDCLKELPATLLLRPLNVETLSTYIYQYATRGSFEEGSLAALIIVLVGIPAVLLISRHADAQIVPNS